MEPPQPLALMMGGLGERGGHFLAELPGRVDAARSRWGLEIGAPYGSSFAFVAPARTPDGRDVVLRISERNDEETALAATALRLYNGEGAVLLLATGDSEQDVLLERAVPGNTLSLQPADDAASTTVVGGSLGQLWRLVPADAPLPTLADRAARLAATLTADWVRLGRPCSRVLVDEAIEACLQLGGNQGPAVLLHCDLHHFNVLAAQRQPWLVIDPAPLVGEREYDVGAFLRNPRGALLDWPHPERTTRRRVDVLCEALRLDPFRVRAWAIVQAVENGLWSTAMGHDAEAIEDFADAELARSLPPSR